MRARASPSHPSGDEPSIAASGTWFSVVGSKLEPPPARSGSVAREGLLARLASASEVPVVTIVAPAGYGKTTTVTQWVQQDPRSCAWLSLDSGDDDPAVLFTYLALALDRVVQVGSTVADWLVDPGQSMAAAANALLGALANARGASVVVFDDVQRLTSGDSLGLLAEVVAHLPAGWQAAFVTREVPTHLPVPRYRAQGQLEELTATDLAMDDVEAAALVRGAGLELDPAHVTRLNRQAEGWPAALHLATLAITAGAPPPDDDAPPIARDRFVSDYVRSEILTRLSSDDVTFLLRTSPLERLSGDLCDAVLDRSGSARKLDSLASRQALVVPLDRQRRWYRCHLLFREVLRAELERREPELVGDLVVRAADWFEANGQPELAAELAMEVRDGERVSHILAVRGQVHYRRGREATVERWASWLDEHDGVGPSCAGAIVGAWAHLLAGRAAAGERWIALAEHEADREGLSPSDPARGDIHAVHAALCRHGVDRMRQDALRALDLTEPDGPWRASAVLMVGVAEFLAGSDEAAEELLAEAVEVSTDLDAVLALLVALAQLTLRSLDRGRLDEARMLGDRLVDHLGTHGLNDAPSSALAHAVIGRIRLQQGDPAAAEEAIGRAQRLRPNLTHAMPWLSVQAGLEMARCAIMQADIAGARTVLREVDAVLSRRPDLGVLGPRAGELAERIAELQADVVGASSLTGAELRLLPLLATHLSFAEIGDQLFVSRNTVKTQAMAIYRKLGVSSRSAAIVAARQRSLLD